VAAGVGVFRAERRPEGLDLGEREAIRLHVELSRHRQKRLAAESHPVGKEWVDPVFGPVRRIPKPTPWQILRGNWLMKQEDQEVARRISEDDLATFEGWLRYQGFDAATLASDELADWRDIFDKARKDSLR
jgi:hypothetical protein